MKKLFFMTLLLLATSALFDSCKPKPKPATVAIMREQGGEFLYSKRAAYSNDSATIIDIYLLDNQYYAYRQRVARTPDDSVGSYSCKDEVGTWARKVDSSQGEPVIDSSKMTLTIPDDSKIRFAIPFNPNVQKHQLNAGSWDYCCECTSPSKCCITWPVGNGYNCVTCSGCGGCLTIGTDLGNTGGDYMFMHEGLTPDNLTIIDVAQ